MRHFVTGCAGFIGSHLTERLLRDGHFVVGYDNFSSGRDAYVLEAARSARFNLVRGDLLDAAALHAALSGCEFVWHLAANADVRHGTEFPRRDLEQNTIATFQVLEAMRAQGIKRIAFASSGAVYGEAAQFPTPEDAPFPVQTSLYGASKSAGEGLISAHCAGYGFQAYIFRFVSIVGERYSHGHIVDFYEQLRRDQKRLRVLGDGRQRKSYLYVHDCIEALMCAVQSAAEPVNIFNLGTEEHCAVDDSIGWICAALGVSPRIEYAGGERGWPGDSPFIFLDTRKIRATGWRASVSIRDGVLKTLAYLRSLA